MFESFEYLLKLLDFAPEYKGGFAYKILIQSVLE